MGIHASEIHGHKPVRGAESTALVPVANTDLTVILDRSGSMSVVRDDMEGGFNQFITEQKNVPGNMQVTLYQFDTLYEKIYEDVDIADVPRLDLVPRGSTALLDSVYKGITDASERMSEKPGSVQVIVIIITDGQENSSREVGIAQVRELIRDREKAGWEFVFLGANQDAFAEAGGMGIKATNAMNYAPTKEGVTTAFSSVSKATTRSRFGGTGNTGGYFDDDERDARQ